MDDTSLSQAMGGTPPKTFVEEAWHTEQERKKYDIIRVVNPTRATVKGTAYDLPPQDFFVKYDTNQYQKISAGEIKDIPRFRAERYVEHMKDKIVNFVNQKLHDDFLAKRDREGLPRYSDKSVENRETYETQSYPRSNDPEVINELYGQLWVGLVNKASSDTPPDMGPRSGEVDVTPTSRKALDSLANKVVVPDDVPQSPEAQPPVEPAHPQESSFSRLNQSLTVDEVSQ